METTIVGQKLRELVNGFMSRLPIPASTPTGEAPVQRGDGVFEYYKYWPVRDDGLYASFSDNDDVIEFGLSERQGDDVRNVLAASLVLGEERGELNVVSETRSDLNGDTYVTPTNAGALEAALRYFAEVFSGREMAR